MTTMRLVVLQLLLLPHLLDAFGASYPGSFYGMLLKMGQARDRKLGRTGPSPPRLWAYHDPSDSGSDSVYHRATEDARGAQKRRRISGVHKPARLRYNSRQRANEMQLTIPTTSFPVESTKAFLPRARDDQKKGQQSNAKHESASTFPLASTPKSFIFHHFSPVTNDFLVPDSIENSIVPETPSSEETTASPKETERMTIDHIGSPMSLGAWERMAAELDPTQSSGRDNAVHSPKFSYFPVPPEMNKEKIDDAQKWSSNLPVISKIPARSIKNVTEKSEKRKFSNQNVQFQHSYPTFHPLRPTMSPADVRKRNEFYEKFAQQQLLLHQQSTNIGEESETDLATDVKNTHEWNQNRIEWKQVPSQIHSGENFHLTNVSNQRNNGADDKELMMAMNPGENRYDHSELLKINEADDYDQILYLQQLKKNQKHLIDSKYKVFPSLHTSDDGKQMVSQANETSVLRKQNLNIPQSFINFNPMKLHIGTHGSQDAISAAGTGVVKSLGSSGSEAGWLERKHQQTLEALQPDPLQQLVLQRQRIALQHLQRNVKPRDDIKQPIKPFFSASLYRRSDAGLQSGADGAAQPSPPLAECGGEFTFELDPFNFARHPRERAFSQHFETPGYGSSKPYSPGLTCLWTVQIGPSCRYGMLVYSLQSSFIRRSHACSQDHLDVIYNGERVSRYCGPLSRQQRVSGAQIWSTSAPKNLTLLFESAPTRRRGDLEQKHWGVAIDVAAYCWGYSEAFKMELNVLKKAKNKAKVTPTPPAATTHVMKEKEETVVPDSATILPDDLDLRESSYNSDPSDSGPSAVAVTVAPDQESETLWTTMMSSPTIDDIIDLEAGITRITTSASPLEESTPIQKLTSASPLEESTPIQKLTSASPLEESTPIQKLTSASPLEESTPIQKLTSASSLEESTPIQMLTSASSLEESTPIQMLTSAPVQSTETTLSTLADILQTETDVFETFTTTENIDVQEENKPKISEAIITIVETAPQSSHGSSFPPKIYTVPITNKIYHIPIRTHANNTPNPVAATGFESVNDLSAATYINVNTQFVNFSQDNPSTHGGGTSAESLSDTTLMTAADDNFIDERVTESVIASLFTSEVDDWTVPVKETAAQTYSRATKFDSTTMSSIEYKYPDDMVNSSAIETIENESSDLAEKIEGTENFLKGETTAVPLPTRGALERLGHENTDASTPSSADNTVSDLMHTTEGTVEPTAKDETFNESGIDSETESIHEFTASPGYFTESTVNLDSESEPTEMLDEILDSQSDLDSNQNSWTADLSEPTSTDTTRPNLTYTETSEVLETSESFNFTPPASQFDSTEAFITETMPEQFTEMTESSSEANSYSNDAKRNEINNEQGEEKKVNKITVVESKNGTIIANNKEKDTKNNALLPEKAKKEDKINVVMSGHDRTMKFRETQVLNKENSTEIQVENQDATETLVLENNTVSGNSRDESSSKNNVTRNELDHERNTTESNAGEVIIAKNKMAKFAESMNSSERNYASENRVNRRDPNRYLRGTVRGRDSTWDPSHTPLYQSHRFRRFPW